MKAWQGTAFVLAFGTALVIRAADGPTGWTSPAGRDFPVVGGNLANQRYSTLTKITRSNIATLGGAWMVHLEDGKAPATMQATPVVVAGVLFIASGTGNVFAIDAATGAIKWKYQSTAGGTIRGVAAAEGKVFSAQGDTSLIALDQTSGALVWKTKLAERGSTSAPATYYGGLVYLGVAGGESGGRGQFGAYDAKTGKEVWKFWTLPGPGDLGHDTWEGDSWKHGGGPVWTHPAIDPALGMVYIAVGNAGPDNDGTASGGKSFMRLTPRWSLVFTAKHASRPRRSVPHPTAPRAAAKLFS